MSGKKSLRVLYVGRDEMYARLIIPSLFPGFEVTVTIGHNAIYSGLFDAVFVDADTQVSLSGPLYQTWTAAATTAAQNGLPVWIVFDPKTVSDLGELIHIAYARGARHFTLKCPTD